VRAPGGAGNGRLVSYQDTTNGRVVS